MSRNKLHGLTTGKASDKRKYHPIYKAWQNMVTRCTNPNANNYHRYGGRGITVCDRWKVSANFVEDMMPTWFPGGTIDRIDNDKGYSPDNCQWITREENVGKTSRVHLVSYGGATMSVRKLCMQLGIESKYQTLMRRLVKGVGLEAALSEVIT